MTENKEKLVKASLRQGALSVETLKIQTELPNGIDNPRLHFLPPLRIGFAERFIGHQNFAAARRDRLDVRRSEQCIETWQGALRCNHIAPFRLQP